jgi:trans-aconitate methyltransferase
MVGRQRVNRPFPGKTRSIRRPYRLLQRDDENQAEISQSHCKSGVVGGAGQAGRIEAVRWNHNIHYQRLVLDRIPAGASRALDVGCGEGILTRELSRRIDTVIGIDKDHGSIERARQAGGNAEYLEHDLLTYTAAPFDLVASIATLHHLDTKAGLEKLKTLVRSEGRLVVIGCAKRSLPHDLPWEFAGAVKTRALQLRHGHWEHHSPVVDPALTHAQTRAIVQDILPTARYRQLALWRYLLDWTAP